MVKENCGVVGIFSMDGDFSKLKEITEITEQNNSIVILDDAHGDFTIGRDGKGTADHFGVAKKNRPVHQQFK